MVDETPDAVDEASAFVDEKTRWRKKSRARFEATKVDEPEPEPEPAPADEPEPEPLDESMEELLGEIVKAPAAKAEPPVTAGEPSFPSPVLSPALSVPAEPEPVEQLTSITDSSSASDLIDEFFFGSQGAVDAGDSIDVAIGASPATDAPVVEASKEPSEPAAPQDPVEADELAPRSDPIPGILLADALGGNSRPGEQSEAPPSMIDETLDEPIGLATPSQTRRSTAVAAESVGALTASVEASPDDWVLHRDLGEAMLDAGDRAGGIRELEFAMAGAERDGKLDLASSIAEEVARIEPEAVKHQQKRVEYAFRTNDRARLIEAYLGLANVLMRTEQGEKSRTIYQRVLDLAPDEPRARLALASLTPARPLPAQRFTPITPSAAHLPRAADAPVARRSSGGSPRPPSGSYINLGDMLRGDDIPRDTRMVVPEQEPTGDEQADFADMLRKFKAGIARNVAPEDHQSHYDLAIAYKEMGLVDEAIAEFQRALAGPTNRLPTYEALGQCFLEKEQFKLASSILSRALSENASEDQLVGILYLLGRAAESQGKADEALAYYQRVFVVDIQFRDIVDRMSEIEQALR